MFAGARRRDASGGDASTGYLYVPMSTQPDSVTWPDTVDDAIKGGLLPDSWTVTDPSGHVSVAQSRARTCPGSCDLAPDGVETAAAEGLRAAYIPSPFGFCLRCRVSYENLRGSEFAKLASLSAEGRSTAVTVVSTSVVRALRAGGRSGLRGGGPQAAHVRGQPAGRRPAGRARQRLRPGRPSCAGRCTTPPPPPARAGCAATRSPPR